MLNASFIKAEMAKLGLNLTDVGTACGVTKEAVSNWLSGESVPRPARLKLLAQRLNLQVGQLLAAPETPTPVVAFRTRERKPVTGSAEDAGVEVGRHLRQLLPFTGSKPLFSPRNLKAPSVEEAFVQEAAAAVRNEMGLSPTEALTDSHLLSQLHEFGALLIPVFWGGDREGHENAMSVYLPDSATSWVVVNLGCRQDDFKYWLAHELGHCLTLHQLRDDDGEAFAERFAQRLLFPDALAEQCLAKMRDSSERLAIAAWYAGQHGISIVTVVRAVQRVAASRNESFEQLDTDAFFAEWKANRDQFPTMAEVYFGTTRPSPLEYVVRSEELFRTPVFKALAAFQREQGGRSPAFIAAALNVGLSEANDLSRVLWERTH